MTESKSHSLVEINIGQNGIRLEGSEDFLAEELSTILDRVDLTARASPEVSEQAKQDDNQAAVQSSQQSLSEDDEVDEGVDAGVEDSALDVVAKRLPKVDADDLEAHFYIEDEEIHIQDPMSIDPKYAFLGYCTIREIMTGEQYHDNNETKKKLIDIEKVNIESWGSVFLYHLRQNGLIKDDPHTDKKRNKPFKITPTGREEFLTWLTE